MLPDKVIELLYSTGLVNTNVCYTVLHWSIHRFGEIPNTGFMKLLSSFLTVLTSLQFYNLLGISQCIYKCYTPARSITMDFPCCKES